MQIFIYVQPTDHPSNSDGGSATLSATMKWGSGTALTFVTTVNMLGNTTDFVTVTVTPGEPALNSVGLEIAIYVCPRPTV